MRLINVYCPERHPGGTIVHPGVQQKKVFAFRSWKGPIVALNGTAWLILQVHFVNLICMNVSRERIINLVQHW